jgi:hypothetical protein
MAQSSRSFDDEFQPQITSTLSTVVDHMHEKMRLTESSSVDDAERMLDEACNDCVKTFTTKMDEIKASVKRGKPDPSSSTYNEDERKYKAYVEAATKGIEKSKNLFDTVFERIRDIVSTVIECIKAGVDWIWNQLNDAFSSIRSLWTF